ncbi:Transposase and inactivated derivatives [Halanaerobium congolense]|nr:Transposase and inactivated derivatives [Halanaerobium congolense]SDN15656.1 Transposase and inactivated derivatives [Halanaerobium congolense]
MPTKYPEEMKRKVVALANNGKKIKDILDEYGMARSTLHKWIKHYNNSGSFKAKDNRTDKEKELIGLRKENKQLKMENDILKQAALILGRK